VKDALSESTQHSVHLTRDTLGKNAILFAIIALLVMDMLSPSLASNGLRWAATGVERESATKQDRNIEEN